MMIIRTLFAAACLCLISGCASQQGQGDTLYAQLGGETGVAAIVADTITLAHKDPRIGFHFEETDDAVFAETLASQICQLTGGACTYEGLDMEEGHAGMEISKAEFDIFVELLIGVLDNNDVSFSAQNALLAIFAPMRHEVIHQ